ncbi:MAG TPA: C25 family cysteine peptidase, partial [Thermoanaerobaculia bacterium]
ALYSQGIEQALLINTTKANEFGTKDTIEFYGLGLDTPSTGARTYWLVKNTGSAKRITTQAASGSTLTGSVPFVYQKIDRNVYAAEIVGTGEGENFFGPIITPSPASQSLTAANVDFTSPTPATLEVVIRGGTDNIEHLAQVELNGNVLGNAAVSNTAQGSFSYSVAHGLLINGANTLTITALNGWDDVSVLVSARLTYRHHLKADNGMLLVTLPASRTVTVTDFPNNTIRALDITDLSSPKALNVTVAADGAKFKATFSTPPSGTRTIAVFSNDRVMSLPTTEKNVASTYSTNASKLRADLVIITNRAFASAAKTLADARNAQSIETVVIDVDDLYDEYTFGVRSPDAIRSFLQNAKSSWRKAPKYAVLLGDASIDPRNYLGLGSFDFVPTKLVATNYIKTASDGWFADFTNNGVESIAIGRLPVRTASQANALVAKLIARDNASQSAAWAKTSVFISDSDETWNFSGASTALTNLVPAAMKPSMKLISYDDASPAQATLNAFNSGSLFVNYLGHGSTELWAANVFNSSNAASLTNSQKLPLVIAMTCLNGMFHDLYTQSLAEALLLAPNGAFAVWASSTLTEPAPQFQANQELLRQLLSQKATLGDAIIAAKKATTDSDVRRSWILLGDPSMRLVK